MQCFVRWILLGCFLLASGCTKLALINYTDVSKKAAEPDFDRSLSISSSRHQINLSFFKRLSNNKLIPVIPSLIDTITFDRVFTKKASEYQQDKAVQENFPLIESGEHIVEIKFKELEFPILAPVIIPDGAKDEVNILVIIAIDPTGKELKNVWVGYDTDEDKQINSEEGIYKSQDGLHYLLHHPDGTVEKWESKFLNSDITQRLPVEDESLPPGAEKSTASQETKTAPVPKENGNTRLPGTLKFPENKPLPPPLPPPSKL